MKSLLAGLLIIAALCLPARAASTDTVNRPTETLESTVASIAQDMTELTREFYRGIPAQVPVEHKVVELRMTSREVPTVPERIRRDRKPVVVPLPSRSTCSGSFVNSDGDILTAKHCVDGDVEIEVQTYDRRRYRAVVIATSPVHDLALVHIDKRNTPFFDLASDVKRGETIFILGSPLGITDTLSTGIVARLDGDYTLVDCSALPGNSGSAVYNKDEKLVGVLSAGFIVLFGMTHLNVVQGLEAVDFFLQYAAEKRRGR